MRTGLARWEYRHFIIFGSTSEFAAEATECAGDQGAWWEFHDNYLQGHARTYSRAGAIELAQREGLHVGRFTQCIDEHQHRERLARIQQEARADGVSSTPTIRINGKPGARSINGIIEQVRAAADAAR